MLVRAMCSSKKQGQVIRYYFRRYSHYLNVLLKVIQLSKLGAKRKDKLADVTRSLKWNSLIKYEAAPKSKRALKNQNTLRFYNNFTH